MSLIDFIYVFYNSKSYSTFEKYFPYFLVNKNNLNFATQ